MLLDYLLMIGFATFVLSRNSHVISQGTLAVGAVVCVHTMTSTSIWPTIRRSLPTNTVFAVPRRVIHITLLDASC